MTTSTFEAINQQSIIPIKLGIVNCYILKSQEGYILIDTGYARKRKELEKELEDIGIKSGNLNLIVLTHQDFDHTGSAANLRNKYNTKIAMHREDSKAVERGDMLWNRKGRNIVTLFILKFLLLVFRIGKFEKFTPDVYLEDGDDLSLYGLEAKVLHLPGHSKGSIGILTDENDLLCGDLLMNFGKQPAKSSLIDIKEQLEVSIERLKEFNINTIYPGHGPPFTLEDFWLDQNLK
jgi:glyoxylase-like metal-dependent hydrolase (beta-lactamase superfamily II)